MHTTQIRKGRLEHRKQEAGRGADSFPKLPQAGNANGSYRVVWR